MFLASISALPSILNLRIWGLDFENGLDKDAMHLDLDRNLLNIWILIRVN